MTKQQPTPLAVQFCHPAPECKVQMNEAPTPVKVPWVVDESGRGCGFRCSSHTRRLISHWGTYIDGNEKPQEGQLAFWGEWEAETLAEKMPAPRGDRLLAHWVHTVTSPLRAKREPFALTTDPCVFGKSFKYCCCQQRKRNSLRHLVSGSLILFGSTIDGSFYLDTVFVVGNTILQYDAAKTDGLPVSKKYKELTLRRIGHGEYTFYRGKTFREGEPYSFTPARPFQKDCPECGKRFELDVDKINCCLPADSDKRLNPDLRRFHIDISADRKTLKKVWKEIRRQVYRAGFLPAVQFGWPK